MRKKQIANDKLGTNICDTYPEERAEIDNMWDDKYIKNFLPSRRKVHATSWINRKEMRIRGPLMHAAMLGQTGGP